MTVTLPLLFATKSHGLPEVSVSVTCGRSFAGWNVAPVKPCVAGLLTTMDGLSEPAELQPTRTTPHTAATPKRRRRLTPDTTVEASRGFTSRLRARPMRGHS